jgi:predicted nucleic acid-binding protein
MSVLYYLDASAWVKRYFAEAGNSWMHTLFRREATLASTALGQIEVAAALARRAAGDLSSGFTTAASRRSGTACCSLR